jgi:cbb3-type cytochrome oxidase subunit 1
LLWAPIPDWLKTIAVADSFGMVLPVVAFMMNIFLTMRGNWNRFITSLPLRFVITGWAAYVLVSYQGSHQAMRSINLITHFSQYVPGHAHLSLLFFAASTLMGALYYIVPRILDCQIYSRRLANVGYGLYVIGFTFFFGGFLLTGLVQGTNWLHQGLPIWSVLPGLRPYMALRASGGVLVVLGFVAFSVNILATAIAQRPAQQPALTEQAQPKVSAAPAPAAGR